ncbi:MULTISPECIES: DUF262 domain-containing protein [Enterobacter]|uniref:DUF262 domain-containing protein n=12 Tax=Enterobacteriaceae TaxID=543 RepID=UPI001237B61D|nr:MULTISPECIES: DUF262 domain-containing protein [Enterobacter]MBE3179135.1 DUF262 domain-containing protein [Enterobacter cloacae complex sp. P26RS]MBE3434773.1 DUF262 domain-containing protein [Enterobacter cloacae complex sp. P21RS]MBE4903868.1 DUF262 domain-containing protein [Enterobacter cloacae complex sp. P9RS]MCU6190083.1 DUF262 domain-containing protein [Enterobacter bugandensis]NME40970.1 DUF262 domain-containing protein [Enterobacter asburiae]
MSDNKSGIPSVSPEVMFIDDLVLSIENGKIVLPEFQRPYVWKEKDIKYLFDSIYKGYPIGSILLWNGGGNDIPTPNYVGGRSVTVSSGERYYIVDGQQRLTTLFCCLSDDIVDENGKWDLYFNLKDNVFTHSSSKIDDPHLISIKSLRKTTSFLKEARRIIELTSDDSLIEKAESLADKIRKYKMAVIKLDGGSLSEVVEVFSRLNSMGKNIGQQDLVYALTYDGNSDSGINKFIDDVKQCFKNHFFDDYNKNEVYLQLIKSAIGFEVYDQDRNKIVERLKTINNNNPNQLESILDALDKTLAFFVKKMLINKFSLLPYTNLLFMAFHYFYSYQGKKSEELLSNWLFFISIYELGRASPSKIEEIIVLFKEGMLPKSLNNNAFLLKAIKNSSPPDLPIKYSAGSASGKTIAIILNNHIGSILQKNKLSVDLGEYSIFPPQTIFRSNLSNFLGSKNFFTSVANENDKVVKIIENEVPTLSLSINDMTKDEIVETRRVAIDNIYHIFATEVTLYLKDKYL